MKELEIKILRLSKAEGWGEIEILHMSLLKKTAVLTIQQDGGPAVAKVCFSDVGTDSRVEFEQELKCYHKFSELRSVPRLISFCDDFFIIEYIGSETLYQLQSSNQQGAFNSLSNLAHVLVEFNQPVGGAGQGVDVNFVSLEVARLVRTLLLCGPKGTKNNFLSHFFLKLIELVFRPILKRIIFNKVGLLCEDGLPMGLRFHGDMHMNNFLVDEAGNIFLIDFERALEKSGLLIDALYALSTYQAIFATTDDEVEEYSSILFTEHSTRREFKYLIKLLNEAVNSNSRFGSRGGITNLPVFVHAIFSRAS